MRYTAFFLVLLLSISLMGETVVTVKPEATVVSSIIRLKDIATVSGANKAQLDTIEVGRVVAPGTARFILRDELFLFTKLPDALRKSITLAGEPRCRIEMKSQDVKITDIETVLREKLQDSLQWNKEQCKISFRCDEKLVLAKMGIDAYTISLGDIRSKSLKGNTWIPVVLEQDGYKERFTIQAVIEVSAEVFVATRRLEAGQEITRADCMTKMMDITMLPSLPLTDFSLGEKYKVKGGIVTEGAVIMVNRVSKAAMISSGTQVTIVSKAGTAQVAISGIARESGNKGDRIAIENSSSKKIIHGIIIEPGVVHVDMGGGV